jgi:hypothetical protein
VVDPPRAALGGDQLDGGDAVGRQAVAARQPAQPAAQRVAGHAHVGRGARQPGQARRRGRPADVQPHGARGRPGRPGRGVDLHPRQPRRLQQDGVLERGERGGVVPGGLRRHAQAEAAGGGHHGGHVGGGGGQGHGRRPLVDVQQPGGAGGVPVRVAGQHQPARQPLPEVLEGRRSEHDGSLLRGRGLHTSDPASRSAPPPPIPRSRGPATANPPVCGVAAPRRGR